MTDNQKKWASEHDWFVCYTQDGVIVEDTMEFAQITFTNFAKLREWAGY